MGPGAETGKVARGDRTPLERVPKKGGRWYTLSAVTTPVTRSFAADHITPVRAYAALRSHVKERSSFLLEAGPAAAGGGRFSILGYRVRTEALYPGGGNALDLLEQDLVSGEPYATFAEALSQALIGYIAYDVVHAMNGIDPWPDETDVARLMRDATVAVFDHAKQTVTIAGRTKGAVERCAWEMTHGPELPALAVPEEGARPEHLDAFVNDATYAMKARRALAYIEKGEASNVMLARGFRSPLRGADPFDVYRALRVLQPAMRHFFLEFGEMPIAEGISILGSADEVLATGPSRVDVLREKFPAASVIGEPRKRATEIIRELEVSSRRAWGGLVGYAIPGGDFELNVARVTVIARRGFFEVTGAAEVAKGTAPEDAEQATWTDARGAFAAIRAAHDVAKAREAAEEAKRAKEEAAAKAKELELELAEAAQTNEGAPPPEGAPPAEGERGG